MCGEVPGPEHVIEGTERNGRGQARPMRQAPDEPALASVLARACSARLLARSRGCIARSRVNTGMRPLPVIKPGQTLSRMVTIRRAPAWCFSLPNMSG